MLIQHRGAAVIGYVHRPRFDDDARALVIGVFFLQVEEVLERGEPHFLV